jgi:hypothetical protein
MSVLNTNIAICQNPECGKEYIISNIDDGYCSFECWEKVNCQTPQKRVESFDMGELFIETKK